MYSFLFHDTEVVIVSLVLSQMFLPRHFDPTGKNQEVLHIAMTATEGKVFAMNLGE